MCLEPRDLKGAAAAEAAVRCAAAIAAEEEAADSERAAEEAAEGSGDSAGGVRAGGWESESERARRCASCASASASAWFSRAAAAGLAHSAIPTAATVPERAWVPSARHLLKTLDSEADLSPPADAVSAGPERARPVWVACSVHLGNELVRLRRPRLRSPLAPALPACCALLFSLRVRGSILRRTARDTRRAGVQFLFLLRR